LYGGTSTFSWYVPAFMWITEGRGGYYYYADRFRR
jgi:hypothetical protein